MNENLKNITQISILLIIFCSVFVLYQNGSIGKLVTKNSIEKTVPETENSSTTQVSEVKVFTENQSSQAENKSNNILCEGNPFAGIGPTTISKIWTDGIRYRVDIDMSNYSIPNRHDMVVFDNTSIYTWRTDQQAGTKVLLSCVENLPTELRKKYYGTSDEFVSIIKNMIKYTCSETNTLDLSIPSNIDFVEPFDKECKTTTQGTSPAQTTTKTKVESTSLKLQLDLINISNPTSNKYTDGVITASNGDRIAIGLKNGSMSQCTLKNTDKDFLSVRGPFYSSETDSVIIEIDLPFTGPSKMYDVEILCTQNSKISLGTAQIKFVYR